MAGGPFHSVQPTVKTGCRRHTGQQSTAPIYLSRKPAGNNLQQIAGLGSFGKLSEFFPAQRKVNVSRKGRYTKPVGIPIFHKPANMSARQLWNAFPLYGANTRLMINTIYQPDMMTVKGYVFFSDIPATVHMPD